jgi:hypothetical protein
MPIRSKVLLRDVVLGAFVAALLTALSSSLSTLPAPGLGIAGMLGIRATPHRPHCD